MTKKVRDKKSAHTLKTSPILCPLEAEDGMGDWQTDWGRDALQRIVILLFALANLADRAAGASFLRRRRVLGIVSHGEVEARAFVIGMASGMPISTDALESNGDAEHLALRLRALALMLCVLLTQRVAFAGASVTRADRQKYAMQADRQMAPPAPPASDTS